MKFLSRWGVVAFVIVVIAFGVWNFLLNGKEVDRVDSLMVEYNQLEPVRNEYQMTLSDLMDKKDSLEMTLEATNELTSNQGFMYSVLLGINSSIPSAYLKLTQIDYLGGNEILIKGMSANDSNILSFIENLAVIDVIDKASLVTMSAEKISNQSIKKFDVKVILIEQETIDSRGSEDGA
jgi:type IV pilus assembly protein PilN